ncbi:LacI family DNA-binding transcriptional regulator [Lactobacillus gasseri]|nr:LacI family DNA-binding transcriptional regulator [Lactobacillus gasseri]MCZ3539514.1 LacI family DNA-binding transcriptional regulator [Lactobacillus gasseri]MCZ3547068.1 LacI family DNA-binding transcriptional regulator [Lactobacillus gasseri]MCZ3548959.1 LacI family DNA-binding transcriptional regulator [Lactobacillus gasseri]MCZ3550697.1 LacI family DNA-binding transcriptional regulator [Lactobacillus gasseri]
MNDVAQLAGVGRGTVSNYINGLHVQDENKQKIKKAIKELNYVPNLQARALKTAQNSYVVFIVPNSWTPFFSELVFKMQNELNRNGFKMILANSHGNPKEEQDILNMAALNQVSGVITTSYSDIYNVMNFSKTINLVSIERYVSEKVPLISSDNYAGGELAAKKLIELKKSRFLVLGREHGHKDVTLVRTKAFKDYMESKKLPVDIFEATLSPSFHNEYYKYLVSHYSNGQVPFDGIFATTDEYGIIAQEVLNTINPELLKKVKIIGFDGAKASKYMPTPIASIRQPVDDIVKFSVKVLIKMIHNEQIPLNYKKILPVSYQEKEKAF